MASIGPPCTSQIGFVHYRAKKRLLEEWNKIGSKYKSKIISNMRQRLDSVIKNKGYPTKDIAEPPETD